MLAAVARAAAALCRTAGSAVSQLRAEGALVAVAAAAARNPGHAELQAGACDVLAALLAGDQAPVDEGLDAGAGARSSLRVWGFELVLGLELVLGFEPGQRTSPVPEGVQL